MNFFKKILQSVLFKIFLCLFLLLWIFSLNWQKSQKPFIYGVSFSKFHADELKLNWQETYLAILDDLKVKNLRLSAHWPMIEPEDGKFNFNELDFQIKEAEKRNVSVILAVGRRLPGWPECHEPEWLKTKGSKVKAESEINAFKQEKLFNYVEAVVNRYKNSSAIRYWQIENEPYLAFFSRSLCGSLDEKLFEKEINLVKSLDPSRKILITDSGEFGTWLGAYSHGDIFGTSIYLYIWWRNAVGPFRYPITPAFFRIKRNFISLLAGKKDAIVIELEAEPWLLQPIIDTPTDIQLSRMGMDKFNEMIEFSSKTGFDQFYLWGAEWWYWMKLNDHSEFWTRAKQLF